MNKQVRMYCIKLNLVRTTRERYLGNLRYDIKQRRYNFRNGLSVYVKNKLGVKKWTEDCSKLFSEIINNSKRYAQIETELKIIKKKIHDLYTINKDLDRNVKSKNIKTKDIIAIGENNLVRTLGLDLNSFTNKIITVKVGDMDDLIVEKIIKDGLTIDDKSYKFFTAGAGQTRTKKFMMILDDEHLDSIMLTLMCGLTIEEINRKGGMNISKFLAYLALNNSGSTVWENFDINKCIVVDNFETMVSATVDFIDRKVNNVPYVDKANRNRTKNMADWNIVRKEMPVPIPHFDGLGLILDKKYTRNIQIRLPWIKGLLTYFNAAAYCKEKGYGTKVKDIDGKEWDIIEDDIKIIFSKSQFKLHNFYTDWEDYCNKFKQFKCTANICMQDSNKIADYKYMETNYQILQQLINMTDKQLDLLTTDFCKLIKWVHTDRNTQLEFLGATSKNKSRDNFQEALRLYPEMLKSAYVKKQIIDKITAEKRKACSGKIELKNSKRVFILSDPTAFCDWLFGKIENPEGYLQDGEVYCNLYKTETKLDVLRNPSLSFEHVIRTNVRATKGKSKWFITNGIYTSTHDVISKVLAFDVDGDEALVIPTGWIIDLAEDMINEYDIKPIYFEMGKAGATEINNSNIADSLLFIYHKSNIGKVSNKLTNLWNSEKPMEKYKLMQKLCAYNNDVIDSAKTLSLPKLPDDIKDVLRKEKYPYFFQWAKNKEELQCKKISNSTMDRLCAKIEAIEYTKFDYNKGFGSFRTSTLMKNKNIEIDKSVIEKYLELEKITLAKINEYAREFDNEDDEDMKKTNFKEMFYGEAKKEFIEYVYDNKLKYHDCVDMIIKYTYKTNVLKMAFLWNVFGYTIIKNLKGNINKSLDDGYMMCNNCGKRVKRETNNQLRCANCSSKQTHKAKGDSKKRLKTA